MRLLLLPLGIAASSAYSSFTTRDEVQQIFTPLQTLVESLQIENAELRRRVDAQEALMALLRADIAELRDDQRYRDLSFATVSASDGARNAAYVGPRGEQPGRRLTGGSPTYVAVDALQIHEFPSGHTCSNTGFVESHPMVVGVDSNGPSVTKRKSLASADISLASISAKDYVPSEIQRIAAPLKVVHTSDCQSAPTLSLPPNTQVGGVEVAQTLGVLIMSTVPELTSGTETLGRPSRALWFSSYSTTTNTIWGSNPYAFDSPAQKALTHACGTSVPICATMTYLGTVASLPGSTANGVTTTSYSNYEGISVTCVPCPA